MPEKPLSDDEVIERIDVAYKRMKRFRNADSTASDRYIDANAFSAGANYFADELDADDGTYEVGPETPQFVPIGQPNYMTINNEIKMAAISMSRPTLHVMANEDPQHGGVAQASEIVSKFWEQQWDNGNWIRETQSGLQKVGICGLGCLWYRWDELRGPSFEHIPSQRLFLDPHSLNLRQLEYGGVRIRMPLRKALRLYDPGDKKHYFTSGGGDKDTKRLDNQVFTISIYFDMLEEVHVFNNHVLHRSENLYRAIPLLFLEGFIDPRDKQLPLGDNVFAAGLNQQIVDLAGIASSAAKYGGQITFADPNQFDEGTKEALMRGEQQQILMSKGPISPQAIPILRIPAEQLSPAWVIARREAQSAMDGVQGVTMTQRGEMASGVTATQSVMAENRAGARPTQARSDYETWLTQMARAFVSLMQKFGGPTRSDPGTDETIQVWRAFRAVHDVRVVESSTSYQNPAADQQSSMQLYTTIVQSFPMWEQLALHGIVKEIPNIKKYAEDVLRAFGRQITEAYWLPAPQPLPGPYQTPPDLLRAMYMIYRYAPFDVQQQIDQQFGLQPSKLPPPQTPPPSGPSPESAAASQQQQHLHDHLMQAQKGRQAAEQELLKAAINSGGQQQPVQQQPVQQQPVQQQPVQQQPVQQQPPAVGDTPPE